MSSQKYQPQIYQIPSHPSQRLKVVLDYFDNLKRWDFDALSKLSTSNFTQQTLPATLGLSPRSKSEDIEFLHSFRDSLKGAPLEINIYEINENKGRIWVHLFMKTVNNEAYFNFTFGSGKDEKLIVNLTEFVDSKVYAGGDNTADNSSSQAQQETTVQA
ncbi:hypothetical protein F5888DRAFT_1638531 [Russula emetica]|nr:hypothetical protein F5888DRAFT_1638531 [Russula emetica]